MTNIPMPLKITEVQNLCFSVILLQRNNVSSKTYGFFSCSMENYQARNKMYRKQCLDRELTKSALPESSGKNEETHLQLKDSSIVIISNINKNEDTIDVINRIVDGKHVRNGSSIYIVVTCSDNEAESNVDSNSTIYFRLSNVSHEFSSSVVPVNVRVNTEQHKAPYGLKIMGGRKDKRLDVQTRKIKEDPQKCLPYFGYCCKNEESPKKSVMSKAGRVNFNVAMDTTEDRPCCCCPKKADEIHNNEFPIPCISSAQSDLIIPMTSKESESQGYRKGIIKASASKYYTSSKSVVLMTPPNSNPVPVKVCSIPPCRNPHHKTTRVQMVSQSTTCVPQDLIGLSVKMEKEKPSVCVDTRGMKCGVRIPCPNKQSVQEDMCTGQCGHIKINDERTVKCQSGTTEKQVELKRQCPCATYSKEIRPRDAGPCFGCGELAGSAKGAQTTQKPGSYDEKKIEKKKNRGIICQCPQLEQSALEYNSEHFNDFEWVDIKEIRKMKSDLTQTTSGFTMDVIPRPAVREDMSFEDALEYYGVLDSAPPVERNDDGCSCVDRVATAAGSSPPSPPLPSGVDCICPGEETSAIDQNLEGLGELESEVKQEIGQWPLKGIRLTIGGKGSRSTGLGGLCCFDMIQLVDGPHLPHTISLLDFKN